MGEGLDGACILIQSNPEQQIIIRLDSSPYIKAGRGNPVEGKGSEEQTKSQRFSYSHCYSYHETTNLHNHKVYAENLASIHTGSVVVMSVSVSPYKHCLVDFVSCVLQACSTNLALTILPPSLWQDSQS